MQKVDFKRSTDGTDTIAIESIVIPQRTKLDEMLHVGLIGQGGHICIWD